MLDLIVESRFVIFFVIFVIITVLLVNILALVIRVLLSLYIKNKKIK